LQNSFEETTDYIISKMLSSLLCLVCHRSSVMKKSNTLFNERREKKFKENIPAFNVQGKSPRFSVSQKKIGDNHPKHFIKLSM
jgi:hypothetical protein